MLYWVPAGPSLTLSPRRKPRRVINVLAASSTDGGGPSSWLDSPAKAERREEEGGVGAGEEREERMKKYVSVADRKRTATYFLPFSQTPFSSDSSFPGTIKHNTTATLNHSSDNRPGHTLHST